MPKNALPVVRPTTNDLHVTWDVPYQPGILRAVGRNRDGRVTCQAETRTAGPPAAIRLSVDRNAITAAPGDVAHVTFDIVDSAGVVVPTAKHRVSFAVTGGAVLAIDNANLQDLEPYSKENRQAHNGRGLAYLRPAQPGPLTVTASAPGLRGASLTITVERGPPYAVIPAAR